MNEVNNTNIGSGKITQLGKGAKIPNSKYYRSYCVSCGEAIRVVKDAIKYPNRCNDCDDHLVIDTRNFLTPRMAVKRSNES